MNLISIRAALFVAAVLPAHAATDLTNPLNTYSGTSQDGFSGYPLVQGTIQPLFLSGDPLAAPPIPASGLEASKLAAGLVPFPVPPGAWETIFFNNTTPPVGEVPGVKFGANRGNPIPNSDPPANQPSGNDGRNYHRTVETDYNTKDFTAYVTVKRSVPSIGTNRRSVFFGLGTGALNTGGSNPDAGTTNAAAYFEMQNGFPNVSRRVQGEGTNLANRELGFSAMSTVQSDSIRMRMSYNSVTRVLTLEVDYDHVPGQPFVSDQISPVIPAHERPVITQTTSIGCSLCHPKFWGPVP